MQRLKSLPSDAAVVVAATAVEQACSNPFRTHDGQLVRCGSRYASVCPSCSRLAVGDWSAIFRSGIFEAAPGAFQFLFVTLTAPSFGRIHHIPKAGEWRRCDCGSYHRPEDDHLRGVPVDVEEYDYFSATAWNRDIGLMWANTRRVLADLLPGMTFAKVYEMQARLALHAHVILRVPADVRIKEEEIAAAIGRVTAVSKIDGIVWSWGSHGVDVKPLTATELNERGGVFVRTTGYMVKMISYVAKAIHTTSVGKHMHEMRMREAAWSMRCDRCPEPNALGWSGRCSALLHSRMGARQVFVTTSRSGKDRAGWSLTKLTRTALRAVRQQCMASKSSTDYETAVLTAAASKRFLQNRLAKPCPAPAPEPRSAGPPPFRPCRYRRTKRRRTGTPLDAARRSAIVGEVQRRRWGVPLSEPEGRWSTRLTLRRSQVDARRFRPVRKIWGKRRSRRPSRTDSD